MRAFLGQFKRWVAMRLVFYLARWAATEARTAGNRTEFLWAHDARVGLVVRFRRLTQPDALTREEVVRKLEQVRAAERRMRWAAPDPGGPKSGKLVYDGEEVPVLYWGPWPVLTDTPEETGLADRARVVISVDAEGTSRVLKDRHPGAVRLV